MDREQTTVAAVSEEMGKYNRVHSACHAQQDAPEPTKSAFRLYDGPLELGEMMKKPRKHAQLAYLSACQTASGDPKLPDEALHLAAGMFMAGYRSVIVTLWSIRDNEASLVAGVIYEHLLADPEGSAARALHYAIGLPRERNERDLLS